MVVNSSTLAKYSSILVSIFPFCFGTLYAYFRYETISISNTILFLIGLFLIQLLKAVHQKRNNHTLSNHHLTNQLYAVIVISFLFVLVRLIYQTNLTVLTLIGLTLIFQSFYYFAPSKRYTPILVGIGTGIFLTMATAYIHLYAQDDFSFQIVSSPLDTFITFSNLLSLVTVSIPIMASTTNLYFSKLIKQQEVDSVTLENSLLIYFALFIIAYAAIILGMINQSLPMLCIFMSFTVYPIIKNMIIFSKDPHAGVPLIRKNYLLFNSVYLLSLGAFILFS